MKGSVQYISFTTEKISASDGARPREQLISRPALNLQSYRGS